MRTNYIFCLLLYANAEIDYDGEFDGPERRATRVNSDDAWEQAMFYKISQEIPRAKIEEFGEFFIPEFARKYGITLTKNDIMEFYRRFYQEYLLGKSSQSRTNNRPTGRSKTTTPEPGLRKKPCFAFSFRFPFLGKGWKRVNIVVYVSRKGWKRETQFHFSFPN